MIVYFYFEVCEMIVMCVEVEVEIKKYFVDFFEFLVDVGDCEEYEGKEVFDWFGYQVIGLVNMDCVVGFVVSSWNFGILDVFVGGVCVWFYYDGDCI